jgi:hypothetical protein
MKTVTVTITEEARDFILELLTDHKDQLHSDEDRLSTEALIQTMKQSTEEQSSLRQLVKSILDDCKLDSNSIEESDSEFIDQLGDGILQWHVKTINQKATS